MSKRTLYVVCGVPGSGKSTAASYLSEQTGAAVLRTDVVRKQIVEEPAYTAEEHERTYDALFDRARDTIREQSVVLDATFCRRSRRDRAEAIARKSGADVTFVRVTCDPSVRDRRIRDRTDDPSDADVRTAHEIAEAFESFERPCVVIDNSGTIESMQQGLRVNVLGR